MTYLEIVNEVLERLRENSVASVTENAQSKRIGHFVNDAKRMVEDAHNWDALATSVTLNTVAAQTTYTVTGSGMRHKDVSANVTTSGNQARMRQVTSKWIQDAQQLTTVQSSRPEYFAWVGNNGTDSYVELYPTPNGVYTISFNMNVPQVKLTSDSDILIVPSEPVIACAYALAKVERGEDGSIQSSEAYQLYKNVLADYIAIEISRDSSLDSWSAV